MKKVLIALSIFTLLLSSQLATVSQAALVGPTVAGAYGNSYIDISDFGSYADSGSVVNIQNNSIFASDTSNALATGSLNWTGTGLVTVSFDYAISSGNNWINYGDAWGEATTISSGSGHITETFNLDNFYGGPLFFQAYADGTTTAGIGSASITNLSVAPVPIPAAAWLLGTGLFGLVALKRRYRP